MRLCYFIILSIFLFSCSSKRETNITVDQIDSLLKQDTGKLPIFKDRELTNYIKEYDTFIKEYLTALKDDDSDKIDELQKQSEELVEKAKNISKKIKTPAQQETFQKWINKQHEKINSLNN